MTFAPRLYPDIVRDMMTTLTGGTVREPAVVPAGDGPIVLDRLADRPIRRVSHLIGRVASPTVDDPDRTVDYRFTSADFELIATDGSTDLNAIRFRDGGQRPAPGTTVTVNYYPVTTGPVPLTDLNVGSVVRTLLETAGRELAVEELQLEQIYRSAFLETAEATALERVVALVGVTRLPKGHVIAKVRFARAEGSTGRITIPTGTVVSDAKDNRFATLDTLVLEPGEPSREAICAGESVATPPVDARVIDRLVVLVAGVASVVNEQPAYRTAAAETDDELRRRARGALHTSSRGTIDAIRFGVRSLPGVKDVAVVEEPNGVPGEIRVDVAYEQTPTDDLLAAVRERIDELRPAGIRALTGQAARLEVGATVQLTLAGTGLPPRDLADVTAGVEQRLAAHVRTLAPGATVRGAQLVSLVLSDARVVDVEITLDAGSGPVGSVTVPAGSVAEARVPFTFPPPLTESGATTSALAHVDVGLPLHLLPATTQADATAALRLAITSFLGARTATAPLTVDGIVAAVRDDTRYVLERSAVIVTVEGADRFLQLTDGTGSYVPAPGETFELRTLDVQVDEGGV